MQCMEFLIALISRPHFSSRSGLSRDFKSDCVRSAFLMMKKKVLEQHNFTSYAMKTVHCTSYVTTALHGNYSTLHRIFLEINLKVF